MLSPVSPISKYEPQAREVLVEPREVEGCGLRFELHSLDVEESGVRFDRSRGGRF